MSSYKLKCTRKAKKNFEEAKKKYSKSKKDAVVFLNNKTFKKIKNLTRKNEKKVINFGSKMCVELKSLNW
jgi:hypothetical protein